MLCQRYSALPSQVMGEDTRMMGRLLWLITEGQRENAGGGEGSMEPLSEAEEIEMSIPMETLA